MARLNDTSLKITSESSAKSGRGGDWIKRTWLHISSVDLTAAATSQTFDFASQLPSGATVLNVGRKVYELFSGGASTSAVVDFGDTANADRFIDNADIFTGATTGWVPETGATVGDGADTAVPFRLAAATTLRATITSDVNVDTLTAGRLSLCVSYFADEDPDA